MANSELVSVIIATYNMSHYLSQAIDSILDQDYSNFEIIVVDDGSTDDTREILACYRDDSRVKIIRQNNAGQTYAKNRGLREAQGNYVAFCDADNTWMPYKLSRQLCQFDTKGIIGVVYSDIVFMNAQGNTLTTPNVIRYQGRITSQLLLDNFVTFNTAIIPRCVINEFGGFDESLTMSIDYDLWLRISTNYEFHYLNEPLVRYRIWGGQMSHSMEERLKNVGIIIDRFFDHYPHTVSYKDKLQAYSRLHVTRARYQTSKGNRAIAWKEFSRALGYRLYDWYTWKSIGMLLLQG